MLRAFFFIAIPIGLIGAIYVYDDSRRRGGTKFWAFGWAVCVLAGLAIFLPLYLVTRPKGLLEIPPMSTWIKFVAFVVCYITIVVLFGIAVFFYLMFSSV